MIGAGDVPDKVVPLYPVEVSVDARGAVDEFCDLMLAPVFQEGEAMSAAYRAQGLPAAREMVLTVSLSETLRAALSAPGAFEVRVAAAGATDTSGGA